MSAAFKDNGGGQGHAVPFIRKHPNGRRSLTTIERPSDILAMANNFVHAGGRYYIGIDERGVVHLQAVLKHEKDGEEIECACDECPHDSNLHNKVDELVRDSFRWLALAGWSARKSSIITDLN